MTKLLRYITQWWAACHSAQHQTFWHLDCAKFKYCVWQVKWTQSFKINFRIHSIEMRENGKLEHESNMSECCISVTFKMFSWNLQRVGRLFYKNKKTLLSNLHLWTQKDYLKYSMTVSSFSINRFLTDWNSLLVLKNELLEFSEKFKWSTFRNPCLA